MSAIGWKADVPTTNNSVMLNVPDKTIHELLVVEQVLLNEIAGGQTFELEADGPDRAILRTQLLEIWFGRGRGNNLTGSEVILRNPPEGIEAEGDSSLWAKFIGVEAVPVIRDDSGKVQTEAPDQIRSELELIAKLTREIFCDPNRSRDAAYFVEGYTAAYNDWASGKF